jgi:hypothetical protein
VILLLPKILTVSPFKEITCSEFLSLQHCVLKALGPRVSMSMPLADPVPTRATIVGIFHHTAMELASSATSVDELDEWLERVIEATQAKVFSWPHLRALGAVSGWDEINQSFTLAIRFFRKRAGPSGEAMSRAENQLSSRDGLLVGRPDRFGVIRDRATLVDFKTSSASEIDRSSESKLVLQLKFYAALLRDNFGVDVIDASIETLSGNRLALRIVGSEADEFGRYVRDSLRDCNDRVAAAAIASDLASPSTDACNYCKLQPVCDTFKSKQEELKLEGGQFVLDSPLRGIESGESTDYLTALFGLPFGSRKVRVVIPSGVAGDGMRTGRRYVITRLRKDASGIYWTPMSQVFSGD